METVTYVTEPEKTMALSTQNTLFIIIMVPISYSV